MADIYMTFPYTPMAQDVYHDRTLQRLRDVERVTPMHGAHLPPVVA
jgi:hypothetical protein